MKMYSTKAMVFGYLCVYVTAKKPNFPERFQANNGKNRNIPERNLSKQTIKYVNQFVDKMHEDRKKKKKEKREIDNF